jgi:hypothetical protein
MDIFKILRDNAACLLTILLLFGWMTLSGHAPARAHSWYPKECCHDGDCAPVDSITRFVPAAGGQALLIVTSKHGTALVPEDFPVRESGDGRMHVCMVRSDTDPFSDIGVVCLFAPPGT